MDHSLRVGEGTATRRLSGSDTISFCFHAQGARNVQSHHALPSRPVSPHFALFFTVFSFILGSYPLQCLFGKLRPHDRSLMSVTLPSKSGYLEEIIHTECCSVFSSSAHLCPPFGIFCLSFAFCSKYFSWVFL